MKIVHASDLHLGFRRFDRIDENGRNLRERDVSQTFSAFIDQTIAIAPDVLLIGGDVFHTKSPANTVIVEALRGFGRLMAALPSLTCILVAGNHDSPVDSATTCILHVLEQLGIRIVDRDPMRIDVAELELSVLCVPDRVGAIVPVFEPNPAAKYNVLLLHGEVGDVVHNYGAETGDRSGGMVVSLEQINPARWTYVALGHYHVYSELAPNVFYAGSIDYTSTDPWRELRDESKLGIAAKGFIERDLDTGAHTVHALPRSRDHIDLTLDAAGMTEYDLAAALVELLEDVWPDEAICRVIVTDCDVKMSALQNVEGFSKQWRKFKARSLNLQIDLRKPVLIQAGTRTIRSVRRTSLEELLGASLMKRELPRDISLEAITKLAQGYLGQADALANDGDMMPDMPAIAS